MKEIAAAYHKIKLIFYIGVIVFLLCVAAADRIEYLFHRINHSYDNNDALMAIYAERQDYVRMADIRRRLHMQGGDEEEEMEPLCAVAEYFEAASLYRVYEEMGDTVRADIQWKRMEDAAGRMGDYSDERAEIDARLGIAE